MKFNLFLLILTTLIAVALNQEVKTVPPRNRIQLAGNHNLYWTIDDDKIVLSEYGTCWTIIPYAKGSYIRDKSGKTVQFNGVGKQISTTNDEVELNHRWLFFPIGRKYNVTINPSQRPVAIVNEQLRVIYPTQLLTRWNLVNC
jgi:hypothetical protein